MNRFTSAGSIAYFIERGLSSPRREDHGGGFFRDAVRCVSVSRSLCIYYNILAQGAWAWYNIAILNQEAEKRGKTSTSVKNRYNDKTYDRINLTVPKGDKDKIKAHAERHDGGSVNGFIQRAIRETMERDGERDA